MPTMRAVVLHEHGGPEVLREELLPVPQPGPGEVRVRVRAVALNHLDLWVRRGGPAFHLEYPHRLGSDIAGEIDAIGPGRGPGRDQGEGAGPQHGRIGQRVVVSPGLSCNRCVQCLSGRDNLCRSYRILGENAQGGYAEYIVVPEQNVAPYPGQLSWPEAAACPLTMLTAWQMLVDKAAVRPGETVLVHGAASGVGVAAIQIARLHGARVIATAGSAAKLALARQLGADEAIEYSAGDWLAEVRRLTDRRGVDVVFEHVGGETFAGSIRAVRNGGRIVTCGATAGFTPAIDLRHVFFRQISILGSTMGSKGMLHEVLAHVAAGRLRPVVDRVVPLAEAAEAHRLLERRAVAGKIVLEV
jgi:NADPH:quinone reductase-like Zn-dependent oxidoreductase